MALYAEISNDIIVNTVLCDDSAHATAMGWVDIDAVTPQPGIGWTTTDGGQTFTAPPPAPVSPQAQAATQLQSMAATDVPDLSTQIQADINTITTTGWANLSAADQQAIILRVLNGFNTTMTAIHTHGIATGILPPS